MLKLFSKSSFHRNLPIKENSSLSQKIVPAPHKSYRHFPDVCTSLYSTRRSGLMTDIQPTEERSAELKEAYNGILKEVKDAAAAASNNEDRSIPRLVAVSKLKPASDILALYNQGVRHFGENYPQELVEKASALPSDIKWQFIGGLQSNKCKMLASIPNLFAIETLPSIKCASMLEKALSSPDANSTRLSKLQVFVQVNTSGETQKSGVAPICTDSSSEKGNEEGELLDLALHVLTQCPSLHLAGLMTIGSYEVSTAEGEENKEFSCLVKCRKALWNRLNAIAKNADPKSSDIGKDSSEILKKSLAELESLAQDSSVEEEALQLSMGMSNDFAQAIKQGSANVRVGSRIFGERPPRH